ncbi:MAG: ATP-binding cassette domain-containing protein [Agathobacter sp.]|nr:ATP-binding cassette domain-containing protein [Agathobacter sp.]
MDNYIIKIENLTKRFGNVTVLNNVNVNFEKEKIHGIVGRNGSGKTMLMKCICGFLKPTEGTITVSEKVVGKDVEIPPDIGVIIETPGFVTNYSGYKNLKLLASVRGKITNDEIVKAMNIVGLDAKNRKHVGKYSLGMRQRLGIAQAIMEKPKILILDEPMNGLDNDGVQHIRNVLLELKEQGTTIILASHNKEDIDVLCDRVCYMDKGRIAIREDNEE